MSFPNESSSFDFLSTPTRRTFLKTMLVAAASLILPKIRADGGNPKSFWFLHKPSGQAWTVDEPVAWSLDNASQPILERARERLVTLDAADPQRVIRLVTRRCKLDVIELQPGRVVVHYWGQQGQGDLRPFFKTHGLARKGVEVVLIDRKRDSTIVQAGDDFLYGDKLDEAFPVELYLNKWRRREVEEPDDDQAAPFSGSNYWWETPPPSKPTPSILPIPWRVLKSVWQNEQARLCRNCGQATLVTRFGYFPSCFYKREPRFIRICLLCRRSFAGDLPTNMAEWMMTNLDQPLLPTYDLMFLKPVKYTLPWTPEGQAHELNSRIVRHLSQIDSGGMYFLETTGRVVRMGKGRTVTLPPFDGPEEHLEEWCRRAIRLIPDEE